MKKFLALVLALVMTMSLVTVGASAKTSFKDDDKIVNTEAVEVLNAMGVIGGYPDGTYRPQATLTRGAGAKLIAYLMLGQEKADKLTATYTVFTDVTDGVGLAGYIEWAAANNIVGGYGDGKFGPYDTLTQFAFGKMLLAALGYDASVEGYTGAGWQKNVYRDAANNGIYDGTESYAACTRDDAARMTLAALLACKVEYGYEANGRYTSSKKAIEVEELWTTYGDLYYMDFAVDVYGRPGHAWDYADDFSAFYGDEAVATYTTKVSECDILVDLGVAKNNYKGERELFYVAEDGIIDYANIDDMTHDADCGRNYSASGQGVLTQVYKVTETDAAGRDHDKYIITYVHTYLAKVLAVHAAEHANYNDELRLEVYDCNTDHNSCDTYGYLYVENNGGYAKNDYLLVNMSGMYGQKQVQVGVDDNEPVNADVYYTDADLEFVENDDEDGEGYMNILGKADSFEGKLTRVTQKDGSVKLTIGGKVYDAATHYGLSVNGLTINETKVYFVDQYGNIIGDKATKDAAAKYAVVDTLAYRYEGLKEYALANLVFAEGSNVSNNDSVHLGDWTKASTTYTMVGTNDENAEFVAPTTGETKGAYVVSDKKATNEAVYCVAGNNYGVVSYKINSDGEYDVTTVGTVYAVSATDNTLVNNGVRLTWSSASGSRVNVTANSGTQFLLWNGDVYEAYLGISNLPTISGVTDVVVVTGDDGYADFVYIHAPNGIYEGSTVHAYVFDPNVASTDKEVIDDDTWYIFKGYVDGAEKEFYFDQSTLSTTGSGVYEITLQKVDGDTLYVKKVSSCDHYKQIQVNTVSDEHDAANLVNLANVSAFYKVDSSNAKITSAAATDIEVGCQILVKLSSGKWSGSSAEASARIAEVVYVIPAGDSAWRIDAPTD